MFMWCYRLHIPLGKYSEDYILDLSQALNVDNIEEEASGYNLYIPSDHFDTRSNDLLIEVEYEMVLVYRAIVHKYIEQESIWESVDMFVNVLRESMMTYKMCIRTQYLCRQHPLKIKTHKV
jgi:hypothetical protein